MAMCPALSYRDTQAGGRGGGGGAEEARPCSPCLVLEGAVQLKEGCSRRGNSTSKGQGWQCACECARKGWGPRRRARRLDTVSLELTGWAEAGAEPELPQTSGEDETRVCGEGGAGGVYAEGGGWRWVVAAFR